MVAQDLRGAASPSMAVSNHPFQGLTTRRLVLGFLGISIGLNFVVSTMGTINILPFPPDDPILVLILYILIFSGLCLLMLRLARRSRFRLAYLVGPWPQGATWKTCGAMAVLLFLFSLGSFQVSYWMLSWVVPGFVQSTLEQTLMLSTQQTAFPGLYQGLTLVSAVVVAPVAEEFLFRGILLHRWGLKWGPRRAVVLTSLVFGLLHDNLVGLSVFGLVMSLLYLSSRSLLVPMLAHALNNGIASAIELMSAQGNADIAADTLQEFQANWWLGLLCLILSTPWIVAYIRRNWPESQTQLPYFINQAERVV